MSTTHEQVWRAASKTLQGMLNPELFSRWFAPIKPMGVSDGTLVLGVANEFYQIWLQDNFLPLIREAVNQGSKQPLQVKFAIAQAVKASSQPVPSTTREKVVQGRPAGAELKLNPRYTFETFVVGPNNSFAHAAAMAVAQSRPGRTILCLSMVVLGSVRPT